MAFAMALRATVRAPARAPLLRHPAAPPAACARRVGSATAATALYLANKSAANNSTTSALAPALAPGPGAEDAVYLHLHRLAQGRAAFEKDQEQRANDALSSAHRHVTDIAAARVLSEIIKSVSVGQTQGSIDFDRVQRADVQRRDGECFVSVSLKPSRTLLDAIKALSKRSDLFLSVDLELPADYIHLGTITWHITRS